MRTVVRMAISLSIGMLGMPALAAEGPPPLIPRAVLFGNAPEDFPQISPDGTRIAYLRPSAEGVQNVWVRTRGKTDDVQVTHDTGQGIYVFTWGWDGTHLLYFQDRNGDENLHLWSADLATSVARDLTPFAGTRAQGYFASPAVPHEILVGLNVRDPRVFDLYRVNIDTGACILDTRNPGDVLGWNVDGALRVRAATAFDAADGHTTIRVRDTADGPWRDLYSTPFGDTPLVGQMNGGSLVAGLSPDGKTVDLVTWRNSDTTRLVRVDAATGTELATLAHDPKCDIREGFNADGSARYAVLLDPASKEVQAVAFEAEKITWRVLDAAVRPDFTVLERELSPRSFVIQGRDRADSTWIVSAFRADGPTSYFVYDRPSRRLEHLFDDVPQLEDYTLAPVEAVHFAARDGLPLLAYLTLPPGVRPRQLPLVLYPHGGPWFRDRWLYDPTVQWLANRGYAVLQVEFRGSTGFGKKHLNAGNGQWGTGSMQHDLSDAVRWAVKKGIADPQRVGILGGSYGGYATLAGLAFTPELYACGVDIVGPSSVTTLLQSIPAWWAPVKRRWILRVGPAATDSVLAAGISPLEHAAAIRAPLLIGHGANDPRVKLAESERIVAALRARNLPVTFVVYPDEGHGFGRPENNLDFFGRAEEFLAKYLGGRSEPWQPVPGSSATVR